MGWGISIDQDENGYVYCHAADFETGPEDYEGYPPHSFPIIYEGVEGHHRDIDFARDEMGIDEARAQCYEAFADAKRSYRRLSIDEKMKLHNEYVKELKEELKGCVVDKTRKKEKEDQIKFFKNEWKNKLEKLEADIAHLEKQLQERRKEYAAARKPLDILEEELRIIMAPAELKKEIQELINREKEWVQDNI
jgi:predicted nuclease with TOPRIM domain